MNRGLRVETCVLRSRKLLLSIAGIAALAILFIVELLNPAPSRAQLQDANTPSDKKEITVSPEILKRYAGVYDLGQLERNLKMTITLENGQLIASGAQVVTGEAKRPLSASSETKFFSKAVDDDFEFFKDDKGKVTGFTLTQHFTGRITNAPKISDDPSFGVVSKGKNGVIVGTMSPEPGLEALRMGGSAVDAVLTSSLASIALGAGSVVSYAGIFTMLYFDAATNKYYNLNAAYNTVLAEDDPMSIPSTFRDFQSFVSADYLSMQPNPSGRTALVPGYMAGVEAAHRRFGKLPFKSIFAPAIDIAEKGFKLEPSMDVMIYTRKDILSRLPETKQIFARDKDGNFYGAGDIFRQPELAATLRAVAEQGSSYMYTGNWVKKLVAAVQRDGGKMTMEDLRNYQVIWSEPIKISHGDFKIYTHGLPAYGGVRIAESLNVAKEANLAGMGHYTKSPEAFFWLAQINKLSLLGFFSDNIRSNLLGGMDASDLTRTTQAYAKKAWSYLASRKFEVKMTPDTAGSNHSEAIVAVDRWGNLAAIVHSINSLPWGNTGIFVDGVSIPDSAIFQKERILWAGRGKRLPDPTMPLIVSRGGKPVAALSAIGSGLHETMLSALLNMLDFNMDLDQAIREPSPIPALKGSEFMPVVFEGDFSKELITGVKKLGLDIDVITRFSPLARNRGYVVGVAIDKTGRRLAVKNPATPGSALAY